MAKQNNKGIVYVLTNLAMPGLVKIGMTTRDSVDSRMTELYSTGVPVPFECAYACEVKISDCAKIEKALHIAFEPNRINKNREFFSIKPEQAIAILELFDRKDITEEVAAEIDSELTSDDKIAVEKSKISRRPPLNFFEMGISEGSVLTYVNDSNVKVKVISHRKVEYNGEETSLTAIIKKIHNLPFAVQPTKYWEFEGKNLRDIYDETYTFDE